MLKRGEWRSLKPVQDYLVTFYDCTETYSRKYQRFARNINTTLNRVDVLSQVSMVMNELSKVTLKFGKLGEQTIKIYS